MFSRRASIGLLALVPAAGAVAGPTVIQVDPGTTHNTTGLSTFQTSGADMAGMTVTVNFAGGGSETVAWAATGVDSGSAVGSGWSVSLAGDSFPIFDFVSATFTAGAWQLSNGSGMAIDSILFDGKPGDTVFDRGNDPNGPNNTPGSAAGFDAGFEEELQQLFGIPGANWVYDVTATYIDQIALNGVVYGDLFRRFELDFAGSGLAFADGDSAIFVQDTDNLELPGDLVVIPLPHSAGLALAGMGALAVRRRRIA